MGEIPPTFDVLLLIEHMNALAPLTEGDLEAMKTAAQIQADERFARALENLSSEGNEVRSSAIFPSTAFQTEGGDNDLAEQVSVLARNFNTFMRTGWVCPPHAAWRIAIILRRMKEPQIERDFLTAWLRHFPSGPGGTFDKLAQRLENMKGRQRPNRPHGHQSA